jgi:ferredoxin-NADP reductase
MVATFISKRELQKNTWEYTFSFTDFVKWKPGDYTYITLKNDSEISDPRGFRRHISLARFNTKKRQFSIAVRLRDSAFKNALHALNPGSNIEFSPPYGELLLPNDENVPLVFIIGGIGITAVLSVLDTLQKDRSLRQIILLYFNKSIETIVYLSELKEYEKIIPNLSIQYSMTNDPNWTGEKGRVTSEMIKKYVPEIFKSYYFTVGPQGMNQVVEDILYDLQIADHQVWREDFTGY